MQCLMCEARMHVQWRPQKNLQVSCSVFLQCSLFTCRLSRFGCRGDVWGVCVVGGVFVLGFLSFFEPNNSTVRTSLDPFTFSRKVTTGCAITNPRIFTVDAGAPMLCTFINNSCVFSPVTILCMCGMFPVSLHLIMRACVRLCNTATQRNDCK